MSHTVNVINDACPNAALRRMVRRTWFALDAKHSPQSICLWTPVSRHQRDCGGSMAGNVGARRIDHLNQVDSREVFLHEWNAKLARHKRIGRDLPNPPRP